ncbi:MAG: B12-binding domain-containing radical SAM protein [Bacteroidales bacterium]|nr:B12-binding domain-containing radical SAM protein [Bacteroidales bacterium]
MKNNNILLINPWIYDFAAYDFWNKPTGLLSIGNLLEKHGYHTFLIDCLDRYHPLNTDLKKKKYGTGKFIRTVVEKPGILKHVPRKYCRYGLALEDFQQALSQVPKPDVVLVTSGMTYWYQGVQFAIEIIKNKFPDVPVVLGGIYATLCYEHAIKYSGADYVIKGQGEVKALQLVDSLTGNNHEIEKDSVEFPEPTYHHYKRLASIPIFTSYGCPFSCSFCASNLLSGKFRQKDPNSVIDEISYYYFKRHVRHFAFFDDALLINQEKHIAVILDGIIKRNLKISLHTPNGIHPREIILELAERMFKTNFKTIRLSYETHDEARQKEMGLKVTDSTLARAIINLEKAGYRRKDIDVYVIMGLPGQNVDEVIESMLFVVSLGAKVRLTSFSPIPGTKDWQRSVELYNMPKDIDPLLTNNSIYPLNRNDFTFDMFQQLRSLSKVLNYGLDHRINFFDQSELAQIICSTLNVTN